MYSILTKSLFRKGLAVASLLFLFCSPLRSQVLQPQRFELPLADSEIQFEIVPAGEYGLFLTRMLASMREREIQVMRLDTAFQQKWNGFIPVDNNYILAGLRSSGQRLFILLRYKDYSKQDFRLVVVEENGTYLSYVIRSYIPFAPTDFAITNKSVLIGGYFNRVPLVLHFSLKDFRSKVLPGLFNEAGELTQIKTYEDNSFDVLISSFNFKRQKTVWIKNYDEDGTLIRNFALEPEEKKNLIFGRSLKSDNHTQLVAGVYSNYYSEYSRGIFIASVDAAGMQQIRYYNFGDLENFFKYMRAKREQRVKSRIERRKVKGKKIRFNYRFLVHELVPYKDQYILLGEAFYPKYHTVDRAYFNGFFFYPSTPNSVIQNGRIFDGYYYTHAVVMGFSPSGDLLWDNSFEINDVRTFALEQFVKLEMNDDKITLLYLFENQLRTKIISNNQVIEGKTYDPIRTNQEGEVAKGSPNNRLEYWYGDFMYAYGVQRLGNERAGIPEKRVFYINKVRP